MVTWEDANCLYCGETKTRPWLDDVKDRLGFVAGSRSFIRCDECGAAQLNPLPRAEDLEDFYPPVYSFAAPATHPSRLRRWVARQEYRWLYRSLYRSDVRRVLRATGQSSGHARRLLDIGCGPGLRLQAFRERGFDVVGMDFQPSVIESLQRELGIAGVCCDVTSLEHRFPPASFDLITAYYVLEHVLDVRGLLEAAKQLLRPGGWLVAAVPLADSLQASALGARWTQVREAPRHVSLPSRRSLGRLVERVGFGDVRWLPDSLRLCAANVGLTLVPGSTSHHAFGRTRWRSLAARAGAIAAASAAAPACWLENYCWRRPSMGLALARKPQSGRTER